MSTKRLFAVVLFIAIFIMTLRPALDPDLWWHLRTGELILESGIPRSDPFSSIAGGLPWTTHEWLTEIALQAGYSTGGLPLLILFFSLLISAAYFLSFLTSSPGSRPYAAGFATLLAALASAPLWGVRPQMVSLFLAALFFFLLDRYRRSGRTIFLIPIPLLMLAWANLHAGYFIGLAEIGVFFVAGALEALVPRWSLTGTSWSNVMSIFLTGLLSLLAALVNPNGIQILFYPFATLGSRSMMAYILEWFSPDFHRPEWIPLIVLLIALIVSGPIGRKKIALAHLLLAAGSGFAALRSMRHVPLFAIVVIPMLAEQFSAFLNPSTAPIKRYKFMDIVNPILVALAVLGAGLQAAAVIASQTASLQRTYPDGATAWIEENQPAGELFNTYRWGGYLIWRLYPEYRVFIDGRADVYGDRLIAEYLQIYQLQPGWEAGLASRDVRLVLVEPGEPLALALGNSADWELGYGDEVSVLFVKK
jgi:hypothetical protein